MVDYFPLSKPIKAVGHFQQHPLDLARPRRMREFLNQDRFWVNANLEKIRIKDMDSDYLLATMVTLVKRANEFELVLAMEYGMNPDACPFTELINTPLFLRMKERYLKLVGNASD